MQRDNELQVTKGAYLLEKLRNMARWVEQEVGKENLPVDVIAGIDGRSETDACVFAGAIRANSDKVTHRNWSGLMHVMRDTNHIPADVQQVIALIYQKEAMHEKFWRYMDLFVEVSGY